MDNITWEDQEALINNTVNFWLVKKYPLKIAYQKNFIKNIIDTLQKQNTEIHDSIYEAFGQLVSLVESSTCYKHFELNGGKFVTLHENCNIISEGTTGLCSWQASVALADWCINNYRIFKDKTVLELGAGVGLTGIAIALKCSPKKIALTDCHSQVLNFLCENVLKNLNDKNTSINTSGKLLLKESVDANTVVEVYNLPWEAINEEVCHEIGKVDVIVAADVIYDCDLFLSLINAIKCFLLNGTERALLACTERNENTLVNFLELLCKQFAIFFIQFNCFIYTVIDVHGLRSEQLELLPSGNIIWPTENPIRLYSIAAK